MYQYHDANGEFISLHDCRTAKASLENNILSLYFPEGIDIEAEHPDNPYQQAAYTGEARLDFHLLYRPDVAVTIYIFTEENDTRDIRELYELSQFLNDINNRQYELEFLYMYQGYQAVSGCKNHPTIKSVICLSLQGRLIIIGMKCTLIKNQGKFMVLAGSLQFSYFKSKRTFS